MAAQIPHFDMPLRYVGGAPKVNQQGTIEDIAACVRAVASTVRNEVPDLPEFGINDPTFEQEPLSTTALTAQITTWEPRAVILIESFPDKYEAAIYNINIKTRVGIQE